MIRTHRPQPNKWEAITKLLANTMSDIDEKLEGIQVALHLDPTADKMMLHELHELQLMRNAIKLTDAQCIDLYQGAV